VRHAKTAGIEEAVDDRSAWAIGADTVKMWTGVFVCTDRFLERHADILLNIITCRTQKVQSTEEYPLIIASVGTWSKRAISIEVAEQKWDDKRFWDVRPRKSVALAWSDTESNKIVNYLLASNTYRD